MCIIPPNSDGILRYAIVRASRSNIYICYLRFRHDIMRDTTVGSSRCNIDDILRDTIVGVSRYRCIYLVIWLIYIYIHTHICIYNLTHIYNHRSRDIHWHILVWSASIVHREANNLIDKMLRMLHTGKAYDLRNPSAFVSTGVDNARDMLTPEVPYSYNVSFEPRAWRSCATEALHRHGHRPLPLAVWQSHYCIGSFKTSDQNWPACNISLYFHLYCFIVEVSMIPFPASTKSSLRWHVYEGKNALILAIPFQFVVDN